VRFFIGANKKITDGITQETFCKWDFLLAPIINHRWQYTKDILQDRFLISADKKMTDGIIQETFCKRYFLLALIKKITDGIIQQTFCKLEFFQR